MRAKRCGLDDYEAFVVHHRYNVPREPQLPRAISSVPSPVEHRCECAWLTIAAERFLDRTSVEHRKPAGWALQQRMQTSYPHLAGRCRS